MLSLTVLAELYPMGFVHGIELLVDKLGGLMGFVHGKAKMVDEVRCGAKNKLFG